MADVYSLFALLYGITMAIGVWELYLLLRQYLLHLRTEKRPVDVADIVSEEDFAKARQYRIDKEFFGLIQKIFSIAQESVFMWYAVLSLLWRAVEGLPLGEYGQSMAFVTAYALIETFISLPFTLYDTFVIEEKHGFNKQTLSFFAVDTLKKLVVTQVIACPVVAALVWIVNNTGDHFAFYLWCFLSFFLFFMITIYPEFIAPLFDKFIALPEGELKEKIEALAARLKFPLKKLFVVHNSKRSAHSNAYMYGFWNNKRIVLYDTLLCGEEKNKVLKEMGEEIPEDDGKGMTIPEVVGVLGHELGHWKLWHFCTNIAIAEANLLLMLSLFSYFYKWPALFAAFGFSSTPALIGLLLVFQYVLSPYNQVMSVVLAVLSRRKEFDADRFSADLGYANELSRSLVKLNKDNLAIPVNDWLFSLCNHSHPPVPERVAALKKFL